MNTVPANDPLYAQQWHLNNTGQSGGTQGIDLNLWNVWTNYTGRGVVVAVVDEGVDFTNPDLAAKIRQDLSFSTIPGDTRGGQPITLATDTHGSDVAGVIAASTNNGIGVAGVAPGALLASVTLNLGQSQAQAQNSDYAPAFTKAVTSYDVVNNSWGTPGFTNFNAPEDLAGGQAIAAAATAGRNGLGSIILFAAGNDRLEGEDSNTSNLNNSSYVISVAAIDHNGRVASYSSPGANILVGGPSQNIIYANVDTDGDGTPDSVEEDIPGTPADDPNTPGDQPGQQLGGGENTPIEGGAPAQGSQEQRAGSPRALVEIARVSNIITTGTTGYGLTETGAPGGDYDFSFGGTSAATPMVSGVAALMLEANPRLGYRDVQDILALTARNTDVSQNWTINSAQDWNGGGMHVNRDVGYGLVDAHAAVRLAETWTSQNTAANELRLSGETVVNQDIPNGGQAVSSSINIPGSIQVERAEVVLDIAHPVAADLTISLVSPSGTKSLIMQTGTDQAFPSGPMSLTSTHYLGENSKGTWTITVNDDNPADASGTFKDWALVLHGKDESADPVYVYTNEYQYYARQDSSRTLLNAAGDVTINASPVTSDSFISLIPGTTGSLDHTPLSLSPVTNVTSFYGGDGNDVVIGNNLGDAISGGRGNDWIAPGQGASVLDGGAGNDVAYFNSDLLDNSFVQSGSDRMVVGPAGTDVLRNIDVLAFRDSVVPVSSLTFRSQDIPGTSGSLAAG